MNTAELINGHSPERRYWRVSNHLYSAFCFVIVLKHIVASILIIEQNEKKIGLETAAYSNVIHL